MKFNSTPKSNVVAPKPIKRVKRPDAVNQSNGVAYEKSPEEILVNILLNSRVTKDIMSESDILTSLELAMSACEPAFIFKAALYARHTIGNRSITHVLAGKALHNRVFSGGDSVCTARNFINAMIKTPNDALEIFSFYVSQYGKRPIPNALKRGIRDAFTRFNSYQLAKYKKSNNAVTLRDLLRLVHPNSTVETEKAMGQLAQGTLKGAVTAQSILAKGGDITETQEELVNLLLSGKLGYSALIFNFVRFFEMDNPEAVSAAIKMLTDRTRILKSLESPLRYYILYKAFESKISEYNDFYKQGVTAIEKAMDISVENVPVYPGKTVCLAHDVSGSMYASIEQKHGSTTSRFTRAEIAAVFMAALLKSNNKLIYMAFNEEIKKIMVPANMHNIHNKSVMQLAEEIKEANDGTDFSKIFDMLNNKPSRFTVEVPKADVIIIITDDQSWMQGRQGVHKMLIDYRKIQNDNTIRLFIWDIAAGNDTSAFTENDPYVDHLYGWSDKVFEVMSRKATSDSALINEINNINIANYIKRGIIVHKTESKNTTRKVRAKEVNIRAKRFRPTAKKKSNE